MDDILEDSISLLNTDDFSLADECDINIVCGASLASLNESRQLINLRYNRSSTKIEVNGNAAFSEIKKEIEERTGVPASEQELLYNGGMKLRDDKSLQYYKISNGAFFSLKQKQKK